MNRASALRRNSFKTNFKLKEENQFLNMHFKTSPKTAKSGHKGKATLFIWHKDGQKNQFSIHFPINKIANAFFSSTKPTKKRDE